MVTLPSRGDPQAPPKGPRSRRRPPSSRSHSSAVVAGVVGCGGGCGSILGGAARAAPTERVGGNGRGGDLGQADAGAPVAVCRRRHHAVGLGRPPRPVVFRVAQIEGLGRRRCRGGSIGGDLARSSSAALTCGRRGGRWLRRI